MAGNDVILFFLFPFPPADITVEAVIADHLLSLVGHVGAHGGEPFEGGEGFSPMNQWTKI